MLSRLFKRRPSDQENIQAGKQEGKVLNNQSEVGGKAADGANTNAKENNGVKEGGAVTRSGSAAITASKKDKSKVAFGERTENVQTRDDEDGSGAVPEAGGRDFKEGGSKAGSRAEGKGKLDRGEVNKAFEGSLSFSATGEPIMRKPRPASASSTGSFFGKPPSGSGSVRATAWRRNMQRQHEEELEDKRRAEAQANLEREAARIALEMAQPDYVSPEEKAAREKQEKIARSGMGRLFPSLVTADVFKDDDTKKTKKRDEGPPQTFMQFLALQKENNANSQPGFKAGKRNKGHNNQAVVHTHLSSEEKEKLDIARQQSESRRAVSYISQPMVKNFRWKGVGIMEPKIEGEVVKIVSMSRASDVSKKTKQIAATQVKARHRDKIGTVNLKLIAAKGLPRVNENGSIDFNVSVRVFNSEGTAKPDFEYTTETIRSNDPLSRLLKAEFGDEFKLDIHEPLSCIEIEFQSVDTRGNKEALGMIRHVVSDIPTQASENWWMLRLKDGAPKTTQISIDMWYEEFVEDAASRRARLKAQKEQNLVDASAEAPIWISAWDVREVRNYSTAVIDARREVLVAIHEGGMEKVSRAAKLVKDLSLMHEETSKEILQIYAILQDNAHEENRLVKKMRELLEGPKSNPQWLTKEIKTVLGQADATGMTSDTREILDIIDLLDWVERGNGAFVPGTASPSHTATSPTGSAIRRAVSSQHENVTAALNA